MLTYIILFLGIAILLFLFTLLAQLLKIERIYRETYFYVERKVKIFIEKDEEVDFNKLV